jgi:hypothetical protein
MLRLINYLQLGIAALLSSSLLLGLAPVQAKPAPPVKPASPTSSPIKFPAKSGEEPSDATEELLLTPDEALPPAGAQISPVNGTVTVKLINKTNAAINYQAVGDTEFRTLAGVSSITLQNLKIPVTLTAYRQDRGLLIMTPKVVEGKAKVLEITLDATTDFSVDKTIIRIEATGLVFVY